MKDIPLIDPICFVVIAKDIEEKRRKMRPKSIDDIQKELRKYFSDRRFT